MSQSPGPSGGEPQRPEAAQGGRPAPAALLAGLIAGLAAFLVVEAAGYLLYERLWSGSTPTLIAVLAVFGAAGAYGGWLLGVLVFSATRGDRPDA